MLLIPALSSPSPPSVGGEIRRPCTLSLPPSFATSSVSSEGSSPAGTNVRKRRAATLSRIDLSAVASLTKELCSSNESLNGDKGIGGGGEGQQSPSLGAEESLATSGLAFSSFAGPPFSDRIDPLKRLRLSSTSSTSTTIGGSSLSSDSDTEFSPQSVASVHVRPQQQQQRPLKQPPTLAELEFEHGDETNSPKQAHFASGGLVIGDDSVGIFELVGDGRNCKAVNIATQSVFHCQVMKSDEFRHLSEIVARVQIASVHYSEDEFEQRRDLLLPLQQLLVVRSSIRAGLVYVLLPDHFGNLHQLVEEENFGSDRRNASSTRLTERRMQPILKQIATLVELCHRIGLFFRDFRLRKFVFTDSERTKIRVNNVLDLCLVDNPTNDLLAFREFVPAYVAPEILDKKNALYGAKAADVWAFGVLMFTLLNGRYPFFESSPSPIALLRRIRAHRLSFPISKSISEPSRWLLHALLNHNPSERPAAEELLGAHWFRTDTTFLEGDLANGSKFSVRGKPKYDNEVPIAFGRLVPSVPGRISPPAAQVPSATARVLFSPTGDSPPSLAELIELRRAQRHSPRWQRQQRASADQMELAWRHNERTRNLRALLADLPLFPRMAAGGTLAAATQQSEANRHGRAAELFERHQRTVSESRRRSSERRRGQSPAFRSAQNSDQSERIPWWAQPMHVLQRQQTHRSEDQAQIVPQRLWLNGHQPLALHHGWVCSRPFLESMMKDYFDLVTSSNVPDSNE